MKNDLPRISVVTPSFNQGQFLEETILSVLGQDYPNVEYRVMDGGSTDGSAEIIRRYADRLAFWTSQPDGGQADAINKGWADSTGEILAYLNADDRYTPGAVSAVARLFQQHPEVGIVYGSCTSNLPDKETKHLYQPPEFSLKRLLLENFIPQPTVFIRRSVLDQVGFLDERLRYCLDYDLWLRCAVAGVQFRRLSGSALAHFRVWFGSKTSQDADGWVAERLLVLERAFSNQTAVGRIRIPKTYLEARSYVTVAYGVSLSGDLKSARRFLGKAFQATPAVLRDPQFFRVGASVLLGHRGSQMVRRAKWALSPNGNGFSKAPSAGRLSIPMGSLHLSGGVKVLVLIGNGMAGKGWQVTFPAPDYAATCPFPLDPRVRIRAISTGPRWLPFPIRKMAYYAKLSLSACAGSDICLANYYLTAYCAFFSRILRNRKAQIVWYLQAYEAGSHGLLADAGRFSRLVRYLLATLSYRLPIPVLCVSEWVKERIGRKDARVVNPPALDLRLFMPDGRGGRESDEIVVGTIGRQGATKGYADFLKAMERVPHASGLRVLVASPIAQEVSPPTGVESERIHARTEREMADFYRRCDIFVLSSRMEGFPLPPLEAMACGCAVVLTACGGVSEYARDGANCLVVPPGSPEKLAQAIHQLQENRPLRESLAREGKLTARRYGQEELVARFLEVLEAGGLLRNRRGVVS